MTVKNCGYSEDDAWEEEIDTEVTNCLHNAPEHATPMDYANLVVNFFNETLKPGECVREVLSATEIK